MDCLLSVQGELPLVAGRDPLLQPGLFVEHSPDPVETQCHHPCLQKGGSFPGDELSGFVLFQGARIHGALPHQPAHLPAA